MEELKKLKCELCGEEAFMLVQIQCATDVAFNPIKGICYSCFKKGELDEKIFMKTKKFIEEQIKSANDKKEFWSKELDKIPDKI